MRILVTGNLGYVGPQLTKVLVESGHEVIGWDLSLFPDSVCGDLPTISKQIVKDYRDISLSDLKDVDAIAHLAGISNDPMGELIPGLTMKINGEGTIKFAKLAKEAGVKIFSFASSCSLYGSAGDKPRNESDPTNPLSEYAESKLLAEQGLAELASENFHVYLLRNATAYGFSPVFRTDLVVNDLASSMQVHNYAEIRSDGTPWRPLINCVDMAKAFQLFIERDPVRVSGTPVNIGFNTENFQVKDVADFVKKIWVGGVISYSANAKADPRDYQVSFQLLEELFPDFHPSQSILQSIQEIKNNLTFIRYSVLSMERKRFVRIVEIKKRINELN